MTPRIDGVLRCMECGEEKPRVPRGLNYGFPKCHGEPMVVVTAAQLQDERDYQDTLEEEARFNASLAS